jgi:hypothetical protein
MDDEIGGLTNRARGGWLEVSYAPWTAHIVLQLVEVSPLSVLVLLFGVLLAKNRRDRHVKSGIYRALHYAAGCCVIVCCC